MGVQFQRHTANAAMSFFVFSGGDMTEPIQPIKITITTNCDPELIKLIANVACQVSYEVSRQLLNTVLNEALAWQGAVTDLKLETLREQMRPVVNITLPDKKPTINVETPTVNNEINLPERKEREIKFTYDEFGHVTRATG
jgi:hypothetical protein